MVRARIKKWVERWRKLGQEESQLNINTPQYRRLLNTKKRLKRLQQIKNVKDRSQLELGIEQRKGQNEISKQNVPSQVGIWRKNEPAIPFAEYVWNEALRYRHERKAGKDIFHRTVPLTLPAELTRYSYSRGSPVSMGELSLKIKGIQFELRLQFSHADQASRFVPAHWLQKMNSGIINHIEPNVTRHHDSSRVLFVITGKLPMDTIESYARQAKRLEIANKALQTYAKKWEKKKANPPTFFANKFDQKKD